MREGFTPLSPLLLVKETNLTGRLRGALAPLLEPLPPLLLRRGGLGGEVNKQPLRGVLTSEDKMGKIRPSPCSLRKIKNLKTKVLRLGTR